MRRQHVILPDTNPARTVLSPGVCAGLATLSGLLCSFAFPRWEGIYTEPLAWVALLPMLWALERGRSLWLVSAAFAATFQLANLAPLIQLKGPWVLMLMLNAPGLMGFALLYGAARRTFPTAWAIAVWVPAAVLAEYVHVTHWPTNAPWWQLGASQARLTPLIQFTSWSGPWGLTAWLLLVNGLTLLTSTTRQRRWPFALAIALLAPWLFGWWGLENASAAQDGAPSPKPTFIRIAAVSTGIPAHAETDRIPLALQASEHAVRDQPDLIAWSEGVSVPGLPDAPGMVNPLRAKVQSWATPLLLAGVKFEAFNGVQHTPSEFEQAVGATYRAQSGNMVLLPTQEHTSRTDQAADAPSDIFKAKRHMVPFQEFMPAADTLPELMARLSPFALHGRAHWFTPGNQAPRPFDVPIQGRTVRIGAPLCFELLFPEAMAQLVASGARLLIWQTNDEDADQGMYAYQMTQFARLRAVETGREIVRVNTDGANALLDERGHMSPPGPRGAGYDTFDTQEQHGLTPYVRHPHAFLLLCATCCLVLANMAWRTRQRDLSRSPAASLL